MKPSSAETSPDQLLADAQHAFAAGRDTEALHAISLALSKRPEWPAALLLQANAALRAGTLDTAIEALQKLCQRVAPTPPLVKSLAAALNKRGSHARREGKEQDALRDFEAALDALPGHPLAGFNRALSLIALGRPADAERALGEHLEQHTQDLEAQLERCLLQPETAQRQSMLERLLAMPDAATLPAELRVRAECAGPAAERAIAPLLELPDRQRLQWAWTLGEQLRLDNFTTEARAAYRSATGVAEAPLRLRLAAALSAPLVAASAEEMRATRLAQMRELQALVDCEADSATGAQVPLEHLAWSHFPLAYMGEDDTALMTTLGALMQRSVERVAPAMAEPPACRHPRRVLLVGSVFRDCTAGAYFGGWIDWLREAGLEVVLYQVGPRRDAETERFASTASRFHFIDETLGLESLAAQLRAESAGLLIYPELGMDARLYPLAALKLARRQAMAWGHPVTAGLRSLDAFFSCAAMEPPAAAAHYVEPLRRLPGLGVDYRRPPRPAAASRAELGLPMHGPLLLVPQSLFKLHPHNDALYAGLLERVPQAQLLLFDDRPSWRTAMERRLQCAGVPMQRLHWLPTGSRARYLQINAACDLMLDSRHFSGGNASLDALQSGLPVLTTPGTFMRGRQTAAMLSRMDLDRALCVATPGAEGSAETLSVRLVERATELLASGEASALRQSIADALPALFEAEEARRSFLEHVEALLA
jgi:predicted O-linked N-acetylglucosamine transferase (SPINDLY family)